MRVPVVVIGAGQAGLAMSHVLARAGIDHVVLERGEVAQTWRSERWDSLRLLTPNWMTRLPGWRYCGADPDGFMTSAELISVLDAYQRHSSALVTTGVEVRRVAKRADGRFEVVAEGGRWVSDAVVAATGACSQPAVPPLAAELPPRITQLDALRYRNPGQLPDGEVLVVGASASGAQIADELQRSGRPVTLAVGEHVRLPRQYRSRDIHWWMDALGLLDERYDQVADVGRARRLPSLQLVGSPERRTLDLNALIAAGVHPVGKLARVAGGRAQFSGGLTHLVANADLKHNRLLDRIDAFVAERGVTGQVGEPERPPPTRLGPPPPTEVALDRFATVIWATGYRPTFSWLDRDAFDRRHRPVHDGGVSAIPGLYFVGLPFMRRRKSNFIDGVGPDAADLLAPIRAHLARPDR